MLTDLPKLKQGKMKYVSSTHTLSEEEIASIRDKLPREWLEHWGKRGLIRQIEKEARLDYYSIEPGQKLDILKLSEPGIIVSMWMTISAADRRFLRNVILRAWWDDEGEPSVEAPLGDFFLQGHRVFSSQSSLAGNAHPLPLGLSSGGFYCYLPMPFRRARIEIENLGAEEVSSFYYIIGYYSNVEVGEMGRFHAIWHREKETSPGEAYTVLRSRGIGHYVGTYLLMRSLSFKRPIIGGLGFLEGNITIFADGEVAYSATGTEDYFLSGWYFTGGTFVAPFHGLLHKDEERGEIAAYRFHIPDPIPFKQHIEVIAPHGEWNEVAADYSSMAYWYQTEPHETFYKLRREDLN